jgi:hypothetical protein
LEIAPGEYLHHRVEAARGDDRRDDSVEENRVRDVAEG